MTTCARCGGELVLDHSSVSDARRWGYLGGRIHCLAGCTSVWLTKHVEQPGRPLNAPLTRQPREIRCRRCANIFIASAPNAAYCFSCGVERDRARARTHSRQKHAA